jgi:tetratricopeptide (TPR) repeat protein
MLYRYIIFVLLFLIVKINLSAQFEETFNVEPPERIKLINEILSKIDRNKDSLMFNNSLINLKNLALKYDDEQCLLLVQLFELPVLKQKSESNVDNAVGTIQRIILQAKEKNYTLIHIHALLAMGDILIFNNRTGAAISYYLRVYELAKEIPPIYLPRTLHALDGYIGTTFYLYGDYPKAKFYIQRCIAGDSANVRSHTQVVRLDLLSQICLKQGEFEQSEFYIRQAMKISDNETHETWWIQPWKGIFIGNLAKIQYYKREYQNAIPGLEDAVRMTMQSDLKDNVSTFGLLLLDCYLRLGKYELAKSILPNVQQAVYNAGSDVNHRDLYRILALMPGTDFTIDRKQQILDSLDYWNFKLIQRKNTDQQMQKELAAEVGLWKMKEEQLKSNIENQLFLRKMLLLIIVFVVIIAVIVIYRKQIHIKKQHQSAKEFELKSSNAFALAQEELEKFKNLLLEKNQQIEFFESTKRNGAIESDVDALKEKSILTEDDWLHFKNLFEKAHPGFLSKLNDKFPRLTTGEVRFILLIKLSLSTKEMASTLGVSTGAIRTMKSRLLKKLNLDENVQIENILKDIGLDIV